MEQKRNYEKLIKALQIASIVFIIAMLIVGLILMKRYDLSVKNAAAFKEILSGSTLTVALIIILFTFVKAFALVITPSLVFVVSGMVFDKLWVAFVVNAISIAVSITIPFFLGKFTGSGFAEKLKNKYPKIKKFDDFIDDNEFFVVFLIKSTGLLPSDTSSMLLGAMGVDFKKFFIATNLGEIPLNILWALLGHKGNFNDPKTFLYVIPVIAFAIFASLVMKLWTNKQAKKKLAAESASQSKVIE